ncbi:MAG: 3-deoxy-manno-octulosonate cytidylyltransferase [Rhodospirillaceae bacterium]|nr:MAG: 3-deoxy-manno-octulosonate cytidylyltransferase [Rhodospirillaceae bacterium]
MSENATLVIIPARMASQRLPGKPLADICGLPMIVQVLKRAMEADVGPVVVACAEPEIKAAVEAHGGQAVLTDPNHPSGSDRIFEALEIVDPQQKYDVVVNLQGDLPTINAAVVHAVLKPMKTKAVDIATLVAEITDEDEKTNPNVVKAVVGFAPGQDTARALYFTRATAPANAGPLYHHIGIYAYRREALKHFVSLNPSVLEQREKLEQLRALENGMRIDVTCVDTVPFGVDTPADLERARAILGTS